MKALTQHSEAAARGSLSARHPLCIKPSLQPRWKHLPRSTPVFVFVLRFSFPSPVLVPPPPLVCRRAGGGQREQLPERCQGLQPERHVQEVPLGLHQPLHQPRVHRRSLQQEEVPQGPATVLRQGKAALLPANRGEKGKAEWKGRRLEVFQSSHIRWKLNVAQRTRFKGRNDFKRGKS